MTYVCTEKVTIKEWLKEIDDLKRRVEELEKENKELKDKLYENRAFYPYNIRNDIKKLLYIKHQ